MNTNYSAEDHRTAKSLIAISTSILVAIFIFCLALLPIAWIKEQRQGGDKWEAYTKAANSQAAIEVPKVFASWSENVVLKDGTIEIWSGAQSELLFIESRQCNVIGSERLTPCWTVWARTNDTQRYYTVRVEVNIEDDWRLRIWEKHGNESRQNALIKALSLQRADVAKKLAAAQVNA